ncbi:MAG TPA: bifunctional precorrin-2 dehydrogenase/sirohydrochlorin ferrochelatase [Candidatus Polarisedimenticolia bacterium]|nr:bifunctional precorrin-2 dehydrogenase/sirohydrochlorin ferrochelatase [Candidatus Polarisedimenticolia bacterium]
MADVARDAVVGGAPRDSAGVGDGPADLSRAAAPLLPLILDVRGVACLVVGGGRVAERKTVTLLGSGAAVRIVAPVATTRLRSLARSRSITWIRSTYRRHHLTGTRLVFATTSNPATNRAVARDAARRGIFVNVADDPSRCTLLVPAVLRRGALLLAVSTSGESPSLARALRDDLRRRLGPEYAAYVRILGGVRRLMRAAFADPVARERRARRLLKAPILPLLRTGRNAEARRAALRAVGLS